MNLDNKFYVELSFTLDPATVEFGVDLGAEGISVFKDEGGVGVAVPMENDQIGIALNMAINKARRHLGIETQPWRIVILNGSLMEAHFANTQDVLPALAAA